MFVILIFLFFFFSYLQFLSSSIKRFTAHSFYDSAKLKAVVSGKPRRQFVRDAAAQLLATGIGLYSSAMTKKDLEHYRGVQDLVFMR
jgi:hypothetical protein